MKDKLTIEQSSELNNLGVPYEKATEVFIIEGFMGNSYRPCYTLSDVLDLLPATASDNADCQWPLLIKNHGKQWSVSYGQIIQFLDKELIDAAFSLLKWIITDYKGYGK